MPENEKYSAHQKALSLNLDESMFGSFAEIGAGQEVARWFLRVGGASGTVAKTISAYDKEVSDQIYGAGTRYVSRPRLEAMLESEWKQLLAQLQATRGGHTRFFAFVDTVSARNYAGTNDCHGWMGLRFLREPGEEPNDIILHVNLMDPSNVQQQEAVGLLGVNLIYAVRHARGSIQELLSTAFEDLSLQRLEIDCFECTGPAFAGWDRDEVHAYLVAGRYAEAVAFQADDQLTPPNELLYKRALVLAPGRFDSVTGLHAELIEGTLAQLPPQEVQETKGGLGLFCLSVAGANTQESTVLAQEIMQRVVMLQKLGYGVMVFRSPELYKMSGFANRYTKSRVHFAIGLSVLLRVIKDSYKDLAGTLLEGIALLFKQNVRLTVYPMSTEELRGRLTADQLTGWKWKETDGMVSADNVQPAAPVDSLYRYLLESGFILAAKPR